MRRAYLRSTAALISTLLCLSLVGCNLHDRTWDVDSDSPPTGGAPPPAPPAPGEVVVTVGSAGNITCKVNGSIVPPLTGDDILRADNSAGPRLVIVEDKSHDRESSFAVNADLDSPDVSSVGRVTVRRLQHNLIVEAEGPARVTLFTSDPQDEVDDIVKFAADGDIDRLAPRLNADPALIDGRESRHGLTALAAAADTGKPGIVEYLLRRKANTEVKDDQGLTSLHRAVNRGRFAIVRQLVQHGADVNAATPAGVTPLQSATARGYRDIAAFLAGAGATGSLPGQAGTPPPPAETSRVFQLSRGRIYGPFADDSQIRYTNNQLYVLRSDQAAQSNWDTYDLPSTRERWTSLEGTHLDVMVRGRGRIWARYRPDDAAPR